MRIDEKNFIKALKKKQDALAEFNNLNLEETTKRYKTDKEIELPFEGEIFIDEITKSKVSTNIKIKAKSLKEKNCIRLEKEFMQFFFYK